MVATRDSWKITPLPSRRAVLEIDRVYSLTEFERIREGFVPHVMEDKWFAYYEAPLLYLHRSWTGICIFQVRLEITGEAVRVTEAIANRDPEQYAEVNYRDDASMLASLVDRYAGREKDGSRRGRP